jgi:hypothetical protein
MIIKKCLICKKEFKRTNFESKRRPCLYCSVECSNKSRVKINNIPGKRWCSRCKKYKDSILFRPGIKPYCRECDNFYARRWYENNLEIATLIKKKGRIRRVYGLEWKKYTQMMENGCEICGSKEKLTVDHNHLTKKTRGILCSTCNYGIGHFKENIEKMEKAILYIKKHN